MIRLPEWLREWVDSPPLLGGWPVKTPELEAWLAPDRKEQWIRLLFPARCVLCEQVLSQETGLLVCDPCRSILTPEPAVWQPCPDWPEFSAWYSPFPYAGGIETAIRQMKYGGQPKHGKTLALLLAEALRDMETFPKFDALVPVPMHPRKERSRGYNQSVILGEELGRYIQLPVRDDLLYKTTMTRPQNGLTREERLRVPEGLYAPVPGAELPEGLRFLLLDDVTTTGSTLRACGAAIREACRLAGAQDEKVNVYALTLSFA